jgi:GH15 family glucan-1,4-alpha-glucosidase
MTTNPIHAPLISRSIEVIKNGQAATGAYLASPTFPTYQYSWFRDGAFIADAMSRVGEIASAEAFFSWCNRILTDRREQILDLVARGERDVEDVALTEHLHTRYTVDGRESGTEWQDFQLDGYGAWLWALDEHSFRHGRDRGAFVEATELTVRYLCTFWDCPFFDWWEENGDKRHPSSLAPIQRGLRVASTWDEISPELRLRARNVAAEIGRTIESLGVHSGHLTKHFGSIDVDASLIACFTPFGLYPPHHDIAVHTIEKIESELVRDGVYRFRDDTYYGGGEWILLAAFLGWHYTVTGRSDRALELADWISSQADSEFNLPEQVATHALHPERIAEWVERWGPSASPLLWSHAMYLTLATALDLPGANDR